MARILAMEAIIPQFRNGSAEPLRDRIILAFPVAEDSLSLRMRNHVLSRLRATV